MNRKEVTRILTEAASHHYIKKLYSIHKEFGVGRRGERRLDLLCLNTKMQLIGIEVKSCRADYTSDSKWMDYLPYTNKLYLMLPPKLVASSFYDQILSDITPHGIGVMTLADTGFVKVIKSAKTREVADPVTMKILIKMAWRNGLTKRDIKRRKKFYLET